MSLVDLNYLILLLLANILISYFINLGHFVHFVQITSSLNFTVQKLLYLCIIAPIRPYYLLCVLSYHQYCDFITWFPIVL